VCLTRFIGQGDGSSVSLTGARILAIWLSVIG
jgi:hypothetical protein